MVVDLFTYFPTRKDAVEFLETVRWPDGPVCPYCGRVGASRLRDDVRFKCNNRACNISYSATVGTLMEGTKLDLRYWFAAIYLIMEPGPLISGRRLARRLGINKNTGCRIVALVSEWVYDPEQRRILIQIADKVRQVLDHGKETAQSNP